MDPSARRAGRPAPPPRPIAGVVLNALSMRLALLVIVLSFVLPADGIGVSLCWFHALTHLPCPGCGLSRSFASLSHGRLQASLLYHPLGVLCYAFAVLLAIANFLPAAWLGSLHGLMLRGERHLRVVYLTAVLGFLIFGLVRLVLGATSVAFFPGLMPTWRLP